MTNDEARRLAERIIRDKVRVEQRTGGAEPQLYSFAGGYEERADHALHLLARALLASPPQGTCGTCRHRDTSYVDMSGKILCMRFWRLVPSPDWYCADHEPTPPDQPAPGEEAR